MHGFLGQEDAHSSPYNLEHEQVDYRANKCSPTEERLGTQEVVTIGKDGKNGNRCPETDAELLEAVE